MDGIITIDTKLAESYQKGYNEGAQAAADDILG